MQTNKIISLVLLLAGIGVAYWGYDMSHTASAEFAAAFSDGPSDEVLYRYVGGGILAAIGAFLLVKK